MSRTEKQIRLCMRIIHRLVRRWYEEQGITCDKDKCTGIKQYGSFTVGYTDNGPVCNITLKPGYDEYIDWDESGNVM